MGGYWWGVLTPFAIVLGILLLWLAGSLFGAIVSWAWKKAHYGLLKKGWIAEDYDEDSREWTTRPGAERLAAALTRSGEYRMLPCFGWMILIVRDHKNEKHDEKGIDPPHIVALTIVVCRCHRPRVHAVGSDDRGMGCRNRRLYADYGSSAIAARPRFCYRQI